MGIVRRAGWSRVVTVAAALATAVPSLAFAETCTMYQKYVKEFGAGTPCADQGSRFREVTASGGTGTFYARKVPKCDADGTDTGCSSNFVSSLDGTRAYYHIDPVPGSHRWVIFFEGGGSCGKMAGLNAAEACFAGDSATVGFDSYVADTGDAHEMTTMHASGNYTVPDRKSGPGILATNPSNPYADHNRVWIHKSTFDRFMGNRTNTKAYGGDDIELYFHGRRVVRALIKDLDRADGTIIVGGESGEEVCDLSDARSVLFVGESGGAGGLIHNAQWLKDQIAEVSPDIQVSFAAASRMLPWLEAEAYFGPTGDGIWDDVYSGTSVVEPNPAGLGGDVDVTYANDTFRPGGEIRELLESWGDIDSASNLFLDASCKAAHSTPGSRWKCFDEGHVALYHTDENMFFYESLLDGVHAGDGSPTFWMETGDFGSGPIALDPGFVWDPPGGRTYVQARANRVLYTIDSILLNTNHRGARGFYAPALNAHTQVMSSGFWSATLQCPAGAPTWSFGEALSEWEAENNSGLCASPGCDYAVVEDTLADYTITYSSGCMGGGWTP